MYLLALLAFLLNILPRVNIGNLLVFHFMLMNGRTDEWTPECMSACIKLNNMLALGSLNNLLPPKVSTRCMFCRVVHPIAMHFSVLSTLCMFSRSWYTLLVKKYPCFEQAACVCCCFFLVKKSLLCWFLWLVKVSYSEWGFNAWMRMAFEFIEGDLLECLVIFVPVVGVQKQ